MKVRTVALRINKQQNYDGPFEGSIKNFFEMATGLFLIVSRTKAKTEWIRD